MKKFRIAGPLWGLALVSLGLAACATPNLRVLENPQAKNAPTAHQRVFEAAFVAQGAGKLDRATNLWREYLNQEPKDYAAHNNLGLVYYTQDRLPESIAHFESALKLSPANQTVKSNLTRSLQFQTSLFKENKEYERAMGHLKRLQTLAPREDFQKLQFMVEEVEDRIYEQVENANRPEDYRRFLKLHPKGVNAERARKKLAELEHNAFMTLPFEEMDPVVPAAEGTLPVTVSRKGGRAAIVEEDLQPEPGQGSGADATVENGPASADNGGNEESDLTGASQRGPEGSGDDGKTSGLSGDGTSGQATDFRGSQFAKIPNTVNPLSLLGPLRVQVMLKNAGSKLNVRANPTSKSPVVGKLKHGDVRLWMGEKRKWVRIQFNNGRIGWISKDFVKKLKRKPIPMEPRTWIPGTIQSDTGSQPPKIPG